MHRNTFKFQMMVEEVKKAKELALIQPKPKSGDDEPDWQDVSALYLLQLCRHLLTQCDQMVILFVQYFAICNKENLPSSMIYCHSWFKIVLNTILTLKITKDK